jgi:acetyltransferase-like isoleucine patch superfamily enzyme
MVNCSDLIERIKFWRSADRIGPDILITHWMLYFKSTMRGLCEKKFKCFGNGSEFRPGSYAEACSKISIGENVVIRPGTFLFADPTTGGGEIIIEDKVLIGPGVHFYTNNHNFSNPDIPIYDQGYPDTNKNNTIILRKGSWIGAGAIILPSVHIGENAVVGAGSIVTKEVLPRSLVAGNPAQLIRNL